MIRASHLFQFLNRSPVAHALACRAGIHVGMPETYQTSRRISTRHAKACATMGGEFRWPWVSNGHPALKQAACSILFACVAVIALSLPALAAVDGKVINKTTGQPAAGVTIRLTSVGEGGMKPVGRTETAADGSFIFDAPAQGMLLLQANWQGVQYTQNLPPMAPKTGVEVIVYDVKAKLDAAKQSQHIVFLESDGQNLIATEMIIYTNDSLTSWYDAKRGTASFFLPAGVKFEDVKGHVTGPGGMPFERDLMPAGEKGVYAIDYPVKPGESRFEISYPAPKPAEFSGRILEPGVMARLVVPSGMEATGDALQSLGKEPQSGAAIYELKKPVFTVAVTGTGSLRAAQGAPQGQPGQANTQEEDGPQVESIFPPGYDRNFLKILVLSIAILALGFAAMFLKGGVGSGRKA